MFEDCDDELEMMIWNIICGSVLKVVVGLIVEEIVLIYLDGLVIIINIEDGEI